jgi:hypothetical protein
VFNFAFSSAPDVQNSEESGGIVVTSFQEDSDFEIWLADSSVSSDKIDATVDGSVCVFLSVPSVDILVVTDA